MPPKKKETKQKLTDFWSTNKNEGDSTQPKKKLKHNNATTTNDTDVINITDDNNDKEKPKQQEKSRVILRNRRKSNDDPEEFEQDEDLDELLSLSYQEVEGGAEVEEDDNITAIGTSASTNIGVTTSSSIATSSSSSYSVGSEIRSKLVFHYDDLSEEERILIAFDMDYTYGPCIGLTRLQRWNRASKLGLQPPAQVKELLSGPCTTNLIECFYENKYISGSNESYDGSGNKIILRYSQKGSKYKLKQKQNGAIKQASDDLSLLPLQLILTILIMVGIRIKMETSFHGTYSSSNKWRG
nr:8646_t:CDS:2 [Entrophospora candida]